MSATLKYANTRTAAAFAADLQRLLQKAGPKELEQIGVILVEEMHMASLETIQGLSYRIANVREHMAEEGFSL
jgi:predicted house-cleaning NTP pyrophosphatase (Maf/HAM1 superfamily)